MQTIKIKDRMSRDTDAIPCPNCGGYADRVKLTKEEIKNQSCGRSYECCGRAFECRICGVRIIGNAHAPDLDI